MLVAEKRTMKSLFALLAALVLVFFHPSECRAQKPQKEALLEQLKSLGVNDYLQLSPDQASALAPLLPKVERAPIRGAPMLVFKKSKAVSHDWIVVSIADLIMIPGVASAIVYFFKDDGELIRADSFNLGWRQGVHSVKVVKFPDINDYLIEIRTGLRQTYAFQNNSVKLVRLQNGSGTPQSSGTPQNNPYHIRNFTYGPLTDYSLNDIERLLRSNDLVDQLHALVWLNGRHCTDTRGEGLNPESQKSIETYLAARKSEDIKKLIEEKQASKNSVVSDLGKWLAQRWPKPLDPDQPDK
jgi:hypothetical protein